MAQVQLILASASPRRSELLRQIGVNFVCEPASIDETVHPGERAADYVCRMAREKGSAIAENYRSPEYVVLAADTIVVLDDEIMGKPSGHGEALAMLARLSGREHRVLTAIWLGCAGAHSEQQVETAVEFIALDQALCEAYLATEEPWDKAGAYAIQGLAGAFVRAIRGSYSNVVGLPLAETHAQLIAHGVQSTLVSAAPEGHA